MNPDIEECESCCPGENIGPGKRYSDIYDWLFNSKKPNGLSQIEEIRIEMDRRIIEEIQKDIVFNNRYLK